MKKIKLLKMWVKVKRKRQVWITGISMVAVFFLYQNCGSSKPASTTTGLTAPTVAPPNQTPGEPLLAVSPSTYYFPIATGNTPLTIQVTNNGSGKATAVTVVELWNGSEFSVVSDQCTGLTLVAGQGCSVVVQYQYGANHAAWNTNYLGITYQDASGAQQQGAVSTLTGAVAAATPTPTPAVNYLTRVNGAYQTSGSNMVCTLPGVSPVGHYHGSCPQGTSFTGNACFVGGPPWGTAYVLPATSGNNGIFAYEPQGSTCGPGDYFDGFSCEYAIVPFGWSPGNPWQNMYFIQAQNLSCNI